MNRIDLKGFEVDMLNLGCGEQINHGLGIDYLDFGQAIVWDVRKGIPLPDHCVKEVHATHFMEHLTRPELYDLFQELRRVVKKGGEIYIITPHSDTDEADYLGHMSYWDDKRARGIVQGLGDALELITWERRGMEFHCRIKVNY
jgi:predicted SAM-dependent methyltransferase